MGDSVQQMSPNEKEIMKRKYKEYILEKKRLKLERSKLQNGSESADNTTMISSISISESESEPVQIQDAYSKSTPIKFSQSLDNPSQVHSPPAGGPPTSPLFKSTPMNTPIQNRRKSLRQKTLQSATEQQQQQLKNKIGHAKKRILKEINEEEDVEAQGSNNAASNEEKISKQSTGEAEEDEKSNTISSKKKKSKVDNATLIHSMEVLVLNKSNNMEIEVDKEKLQVEEQEHEKSKIEVDVDIEVESNDKSLMEIVEKEKTASSSPARNNNRDDVENMNETDGGETVAGEGEKSMINFLKKEERNKYRTFKNIQSVNYQIQEINGYDQDMNIYSIKNENRKLTESYPGVLSSRLIDKKIAYVKIEPKTARPFEFKTDANLFFTVIEGSVLLKSQELTTDLKAGADVKCLQSVKITLGESFFIPARTVYCLINIDETEAQLVLFMEKIK